MWDNLIYFWKWDCQTDKIYLRLDDDTVYMSEDFVDKMFRARISNP